MPSIRVFTGPNGSGKSTVTQQLTDSAPGTRNSDFALAIGRQL